jgi:hypothetical protein
LDARVSPCLSWHGVGIGAVVPALRKLDRKLSRLLQGSPDIAGSRSRPRRTKASHCRGIELAQCTSSRGVEQSSGARPIHPWCRRDERSDGANRGGRRWSAMRGPAEGRKRALSRGIRLSPPSRARERRWAETTLVSANKHDGRILRAVFPEQCKEGLRPNTP